MGILRWRTPIKVLVLRVVGAATGIALIGITANLFILLGCYWPLVKWSKEFYKSWAPVLERQAFLII